MEQLKCIDGVKSSSLAHERADYLSCVCFQNKGMDEADAEGADHTNRHRQRYEAPGPGEVKLQRGMSWAKMSATGLCIKHRQLLFSSRLHTVT